MTMGDGCRIMFCESEVVTSIFFNQASPFSKDLDMSFYLLVSEITQSAKYYITAPNVSAVGVLCNPMLPVVDPFSVSMDNKTAAVAD